MTLRSIIVYQNAKVGIFDLKLNDFAKIATDWTTVYPYMIIAQTIAQVTTRALCGLELARNDEWIKMSVETTITAMATGAEIREKYPPYLRWLAPYRQAGSKLELANRKRAAEVLSPILEKRLAGKGDGTGNSDGIQWLLAAAGARKKTALELADEQLFLSIASIHSTAASTMSFIHDLADHRKYYKEILEEIQQVQKEHGRKWTKQSLAKLDKLDSFMKESQRVNPIGLGETFSQLDMFQSQMYTYLCRSHCNPSHRKTLHLQRRPSPPGKHSHFLPHGRT